MDEKRHLDWDGCFNVRDLGGLPGADGCRTRWGALVRADALDGLSDAGWEALTEHGVRTVIDLRNDDEHGPDAAPRPQGLTTLRIPLDVAEDREFWRVWRDGPQFGTPLYYRPHIERFPERSAAVLAAVVDARPGGVVFHCGSGRDRAGQIAMLALAIAGVSPGLIAMDYALSYQRLPARYAARGEPDQGPLLREYLAEQNTTSEAIIVDLLTSIDVPRVLRDGGLTDGQIERLHDRVLGTRGTLLR
jgi:protein-tyrosine phosphatase